VLALGKSFPLSFAQAEAIGLTVPPKEPPPRRNPGSPRLAALLLLAEIVTALFSAYRGALDRLAVHHTRAGVRGWPG
jgi:hypothetical protein